MNNLPPQNTPPVDGSGQMSQAWTQWLAGVARKGGTVPQSVTDSITAAAAAAAAAGARADAVQAALAARPAWEVGDYRPSVSANLGPNWLPCDGTSFASASFPALERVLATITPASSTGGRRFLPTIGSTFDANRPAPDGPAVMRWWIKAA